MTFMRERQKILADHPQQNVGVESLEETRGRRGVQMPRSPTFDVILWRKESRFDPPRGVVQRSRLRYGVQQYRRFHRQSMCELHQTHQAYVLLAPLMAPTKLRCSSASSAGFSCDSSFPSRNSRTRFPSNVLGSRMTTIVFIHSVPFAPLLYSYLRWSTKS